MDPPSTRSGSIYRRPGPLGVAAAGLGGLLCAAAGLGAAEVVAGSTSTLRSPVLDVGDRVVDRVPVWAKDLAIDWFGTNDKVALLVGIGVILGLYAVFVGVVGLRWNRALGLAGIAAFGLLGALASLNARTGATAASVLPSVVGALVAAACLWYLGRPRPATGDLPPRAGLRHPSERRRFLAQTGILAVAGVLLAVTGRRLEARFSAADSRAAIRLPTADVPAAAVPTGAQAPGAVPLFTPNSTFYRIDTALSVPQVPAEGWDLAVTGMVRRPLRLSFDELLGRRIEEHDITLACVSNTIGGDLIGNARWMGVRLDDLLADAGIEPGADQIVGRSVDGYTCGFPVAALDGRDAMVAFGMNGEPLPLEHGFPARLIVPGIYGYASATKWLTEIELTTFDEFDHYWVPRGYSAEAPIKLQSRIDQPRGLDRISPGPFAVAGVAWAQTVGIDAVELRVDDGEWQATQLAAEVNDTTWRQWSFPWDAQPGRHTLEVRAVDRNGAIQTAERTEPLPNGASGHHTVVVLVDEA